MSATHTRTSSLVSLAGATAAALLSQGASATLVLSDGQTHTIATTSEDIAISNGTSVHVVSGGRVEADSSGRAVRLGAGPAAALDISGTGELNGDISNQLGGGGWFINVSGDARVNGTVSSSEEDTLTLSGNAVVSGGIRGMQVVNISGNATVHGGILQLGSTFQQRIDMSGGYVFGASSADRGGDGINPYYEAVALHMTGGVIAGGNGGDRGGAGVYCSSNCPGPDIRGGVIRGGNGGNYGGHALDIEVWSESVIYGGTFLGGNGGLIGGNALDISSERFAEFTVMGGVFDAGFGGVSDGWLGVFGYYTTFNLMGGQFGYTNPGLGFRIGHEMNVYGWDLQLTDGLLTGYLMDGSWISAPISGREGTRVSLFNVDRSVPEPGTLALFTLGIAGTLIARRRRSTLHSARKQ